jgi:acetylornithine deacetylase/succinyl-diaminopimelate desuccinylase-like protein
MDGGRTRQFVDKLWDSSIIPELEKYIRIPNKSPLYDANWRERGYMDQAVALIEAWCREQHLPGLKMEVLKPEGRTPLIFMEIPGDSSQTVLLYGHLDKQPEMTGWRDGLGPWTPVIEGDKLFGRGGADDGYSAFAALAAISALQNQKVPHARCVVLIEACEESGSVDLPYYIEQLSDRIGIPGLVICLDSGCGNYDQLWCTTSLRGLVNGDLVVELIKEGVHSGDASGVVPDSFRVVRQLLGRLEDDRTGEILPREFHVPVSEQRLQQVAESAAILGTDVYAKFPFHEGVRPVTGDLTQLILNRTWRPALSITGAGGLPSLDNAGNVCRPMSAVKVSLRIPPGCDAAEAGRRLKQLFEEDPPYGAKVRFDYSQTASGWSAPEMSPWLLKSVDESSRTFFGEKAAYMGEGGSIPFMDMLGKRYPAAQFLITGVLGPNSNAHGPNEFLHIPTGKKLTCCVAQVLADHCEAAPGA